MLVSVMAGTSPLEAAIAAWQQILDQNEGAMVKALAEEQINATARNYYLTYALELEAED